MRRVDVIFPDGRAVLDRHLMRVAGTTALTSFGTFKWRDNAWRWVADDRVVLRGIPAP